MSGQLSGIRVVDLTRILAGPFCTVMLGDMGAEVIKVETPGQGDPLRGQGAMRDGLSWYFAAFNRNKKSVALNLRTDEGKAALARLIETSDVLVENYRPGVLAAMGFDDTRLRELKPDLVVCSLSGFGDGGPYRERPSFDFIAQAMSGFMAVTGDADGAPMRAGPPIADLVAGLYGALGICAALVKRGRSGAGERVGASLNSGLMSLLAFLAANYFATGAVPARSGNDHAIVSPYGLFRTKKGEVAIAPSQEQSYQRLVDALGAPEWRDDPRFATNDLRLENRAAMNAAVEERLSQAAADEWIERLNAAGVPCGRVMGLAEVFADPQVLAQQMVLDQHHPGHGMVRMLGFPVKFAEAPCELRLPAPEIGADTDAVLRELGYSTTELASLRERGAL
ncbi:MAG TPA: CoA transferase [Stellaceae bacterium]|jgi:crotonobetainyl-CoA:carnitine CoA-transferase CaiB-like acyl-CoA transferase